MLACKQEAEYGKHYSLPAEYRHGSTAYFRPFWLLVYTFFVWKHTYKVSWTWRFLTSANKPCQTISISDDWKLKSTVFTKDTNFWVLEIHWKIFESDVIEKVGTLCLLSSPIGLLPAQLTPSRPLPVFLVSVLWLSTSHHVCICVSLY